MIIRFKPQPHELPRLEVDPIGPRIRSFADLIAKQKLLRRDRLVKLRLVARFSRWLQRHRITLKELDDGRLAKLLDDLADHPEVPKPGLLDRHLYFKELLRLQRELIRLQDWVVNQKLKVSRV